MYKRQGLVFSFSWLAPEAPIDGYALPYRQTIERVRAAQALAAAQPVAAG